VILQCYDRRFELVKIKPNINEIKEYIDTVKSSAKEIEKREKVLIACLEGKKLTQREIDHATDPMQYFKTNNRIV
jgi:hypothetical protein